MEDLPHLEIPPPGCGHGLASSCVLLLVKLRFEPSTTAASRGSPRSPPSSSPSTTPRPRRSCSTAAPTPPSSSSSSGPSSSSPPSPPRCRQFATTTSSSWGTPPSPTSSSPPPSPTSGRGSPTGHGYPSRGGYGGDFDPRVGIDGGSGGGERWAGRVWGWHTRPRTRRVPSGGKMPCFTMPPRSLLFLLFIIIPTSMSDSFDQGPRYEYGFTYDDGFVVGELLLKGVASATSGAIELTNGVPMVKGHAFNWRQVAPVSSFSATFVFIIIPSENLGVLSGHGLAFTLSTKIDFMFSALPAQYLGILDATNFPNQLFAVEFDTFKDPEFSDIDDNHVGINVNSMVSINSHTAGYYTANGTFAPLRLASGEPMQVWVDYNGNSQTLNVSLAPYSKQKPQRPLLSSTVNLTSVLGNDSVYTGFSSTTGRHIWSRHYIIGWGFNTTGEAQLLNYAGMSQVIKKVIQKIDDGQEVHRLHNQKEIVLAIVIPTVFVILVIPVVLYVLRKKARKNCEWEIECGPPSFTYNDLATATRNFSDRVVLGKGGFGKVYKGVLQTSKQNVAIKRVSPESKQGMKEFIAEITILGHLRHRNLVHLLGYSRHKNELLLVYDYMPNGSLDGVLYGQDRKLLDWVYRLNIIKGIASGLFYLHEEWEKVIIHRDIKTSNVLLDSEMNSRLGDFGLARLHNHGTDGHTTRFAGTWGYIAPELARLGRATKETDVFAFGVVMLEVACGRRPIEVNNSGEPVLLTDWVIRAWESGSVLMTVDPRLEDYSREEVELVLKLGLLCSHSVPSARPCMRLVMQYLEKDAPLPDLQPICFSLTNMDEGFDQYIMPRPSVATATTRLSGGR